MPRDVPVSREKRDELLELENVIGHAIGYAEVDGEKSDYVCVIAYVEEKVDEDELDPDDIIPWSLDGIRTDVIETSKPKSIGPYADEDDGPKGARNDVHRPVIGGIEGFGGDADNFGSIGTGLLYDADDDPVVVTNRHVACNEDNDCTGSSFYQGVEDDGEGWYDYDTEDQLIGTVKTLGPLDETATGSDADDNLDAAYIKLDDADVDAIARMWGMDEMLSPSDAGLGDLVVNNGRTTGITNARVVSVDASVDVAFEFGDVTLTGVDELETLVIPGDSGSTTGKLTSNGNYAPAGLVMASNEEDRGWQHPMSDVEADLGSLERGETGDETDVGADTDSEPWYESTVFDYSGRVDGVELHVLMSATGGGESPDTGPTVEIEVGSELIETFEPELDSGEYQLETVEYDGSLDDEVAVTTEWEYDGTEESHEDSTDIEQQTTEPAEWDVLMQALNNARVVDAASDIPDGVEGFFYVIEDDELRFEGPKSLLIQTEEI